MKKTLLFVLALAVIPVGVDAQGTPSDSCSDMTVLSPLEDLRSCAEQGDADLQLMLGDMYYTGTGGYYLLPVDYAEAARWYRLAAEQGLAEAQSGLGHIYSDGEGVPEDDVEGVRWYRLAAEQGFAEAQNNLGRMYSSGEGVPEDGVLAYNVVQSRCGPRK